jgi:hypothetical protein
MILSAECMFGKNEVLHRECYWTDTATKISAICIELIDQKATTPQVGEKSENKNQHPEHLESLLQGVRSTFKRIVD